MIEAILVDLGDTLVEQQVDDRLPLSRLGLRAFPDARPAVESWHRAGYRLAIVSNTTQSDGDEIARAVRPLGLSGFWSAIVTSVEVGHEKPHPSMFTQALEALGCSAASAVMVGDDIAKDVGGAAALGLTTVHLNRGGAPVDPAPSRPDFTVRSLLEVIDLLTDDPSPGHGPRSAPRSAE